MVADLTTLVEPASVTVCHQPLEGVQASKHVKGMKFQKVVKAKGKSNLKHPVRWKANGGRHRRIH